MSLTRLIVWLEFWQAYRNEARREAAEKEYRRNMEKLAKSNQITPGEVRKGKPRNSRV